MTSEKKTVLVTGGAQRVGRFLVEQLAAAGHAVVIHANRSLEQAEALSVSLRTKSCRTWAVAGDLADATTPASLIDEAAKLAGAPLSGLVNSASVFDYDAPGAIDAAAFDHAMAVNLRAPALLSEAFHAQADPVHDNCIVHLLDQKLWNLNPDFYSYTLSKAGLLAGMDMMARAFAPRVRVNAIAPGLLLPSFDQTQQEFEEVASRNPLQRPIGLENVGSALAFLLDNTSLTAQVIHTDNGQRLAGGARDVMFENRDPT